MWQCGPSLALLVGGCGLATDCGRRSRRRGQCPDRPRGADRNGGKPSNFSLTDEERQVRDLARAIIPPPNNRNRWDTVFRDYVLDDIEWPGTAKEKRAGEVRSRRLLDGSHEDERRSGIRLCQADH
jgi:hypothetical protein